MLTRLSIFMAALTAGVAGAQPTATLRSFSEAPRDTDTIAYNIGERFTGPGALSFGRFGARRQIVLPEGEWVALAGTDWRTPLMSSQTVSGVRASMSTLVFGRFDGDRLATMLQFTANTRPAPTLTTGAIGSTWPDAVRCDAPGPTRVFHERLRPDAFRDDCISVGRHPDPLAEPWPGHEEVRRNLERLGGRAGAASVVTTVSFSEMRRYGYLGVVRIDWPAEANVDAHAAAMRAWAADYRKAALEGYRSDYAGTTLVPSK